jgi:hypothetical protein
MFYPSKMRAVTNHQLQALINHLITESIIMNIELQKRAIKLQDRQRKAEDAGDMATADRLQKLIEKLYNRDN